MRIKTKTATATATTVGNWNRGRGIEFEIKINPVGGRSEIKTRGCQITLKSTSHSAIELPLVLKIILCFCPST